MEKGKLELQMWLFFEQLSFLWEKDNRLNENIKAAQLNAELEI
jgi:hypothetical protein